jgi:hypothetical protein
MIPAEPDVAICFHGPAGASAADEFACGLAAIGFRVAGHGVAAEGNDRDRHAAIEASADAIVLLTPGAETALIDPASRLHHDVQAALRGGCVIVPVRWPGVSLPAADRLPGAFRVLRTQPSLTFDPDKPRASLQRVAHALSSDAEVADRRLMRRATRLAWLTAVILLTTVASFVVPAVYRWATTPPPKPPLAPYALHWTGFLQALGPATDGVSGLTDGSAVPAGSRVALVFATSADGHAYVFGRTRAGDVEVLFPAQAMRGASRVRAGVANRVPAGDAWLEQGGGRELTSVVIVAGYDPLENLEELVEEAETGSDAGARLDLLDSTLAGLLDGRHGGRASAARTRSGQSIDRRLGVPPAPGAATVTLPGGALARRPLVLQAGLVSAAVELRFAQ